MRAALDPETKTLTVAFETPRDAREYLAEARVVGGFQVELERRLAQYDTVTLVAELEAKGEPVLEGYVARIVEASSGRFETAFVVRDWLAPGVDELLARLARAPVSNSVEQSTASEPAEIEPGPGEVRGVAAVHRIQQMNLGQKAIHAQRSGRAERQVLLRDNAPQVLQGLLANPRLEAKEVLRIAKSNHATGAILQRIAGDARWGKNPEILAAVVRNPKSPTLVVTRLVDKLRTSDLRQMAKMSSGLKEVVRKVALREYMKRSGQ